VSKVYFLTFYIMKRIFSILLGFSFLLVGMTTAFAASGSNLVNVDSCEDVQTGVEITRFGNPVSYVLTNDIRDAGYGLQDYKLHCTSATQYSVEWADVAVTPAVTEPLSFSVTLTSDPIASNRMEAKNGSVNLNVGDPIVFTPNIEQSGVVNNSWKWRYDNNFLRCAATPEFDSPTFKCVALKKGVSRVSIKMQPEMRDGTGRVVESNLIYVNVKEKIEATASKPETSGTDTAEPTETTTGQTSSSENSITHIQLSITGWNAGLPYIAWSSYPDADGYKVFTKEGLVNREELLNTEGFYKTKTTRAHQMVKMFTNTNYSAVVVPYRLSNGTRRLVLSGASDVIQFKAGDNDSTATTNSSTTSLPPATSGYSCGNSKDGDGTYNACIGDSITHVTTGLIARVSAYTDNYLRLALSGTIHTQVVTIQRGKTKRVKTNSGRIVKLTYYKLDTSNTIVVLGVFTETTSSPPPSTSSSSGSSSNSSSSSTLSPSPTSSATTCSNNALGDDGTWVVCNGNTFTHRPSGMTITVRRAGTKIAWVDLSGSKQRALRLYPDKPRQVVANNGIKVALTLTEAKIGSAAIRISSSGTKSAIAPLVSQSPATSAQTSSQMSCGGSKGGDGEYSGCKNDSITHTPTGLIATINSYSERYVRLILSGSAKAQSLLVQKNKTSRVKLNDGTIVYFTYTDTDAKYGAFVKIESGFDTSVQQPTRSYPYTGANGIGYTESDFNNSKAVISGNGNNGSAWFSWTNPATKYIDGFVLYVTEGDFIGGLSNYTPIFLTSYSYLYPKTFSNNTHVSAYVYPYIKLKNGATKYIRPGSKVTVAVKGLSSYNVNSAQTTPAQQTLAGESGSNLVNAYSCRNVSNGVMIRHNSGDAETLLSNGVRYDPEHGWHDYTIYCTSTKQYLVKFVAASDPSSSNTTGNAGNSGASSANIGTVVLTAKSTDKDISLDWNDLSGLGTTFDSYNILRKKGSYDTLDGIGISKAYVSYGSYYNLGNLTPGETWTIQVVPTKNKAEVGTRSNVVHITVQSAASDTGSLMFTQNPTGGTLNNGRGVTALSFNAIAQNESIGISELAFKVTTTGNIDLVH